VAITSLAHSSEAHTIQHSWGAYFGLALSWLLSMAGIPAHEIQDAIDNAMIRLTKTWPAPYAADINDAAEDLARSVVAHQTGDSTTATRPPSRRMAAPTPAMTARVLAALESTR
jgi:hypothetical protein